MNEISERYRKIAGRFTATVTAVPDESWYAPAPCEGWVARDVVRHLAEWVPGFFESRAEIELPGPTSVDDDPGEAWARLDEALQAALDDPDVAGRDCDSPMGTTTVAQAIDTFVTPDVLVHTWDLARATGLDETLDPEEVHRLLVSMEPIDDMLRSSGHYGPKVDVVDGADDQTRLIAFLGRHP